VGTSKLRYKIFSNIEDFLIVAESISKATPIFLDSDLGGGIKGQSFAPLLREMGFQKVLLATNYAGLQGTSFDGIHQVIGKAFDPAMGFVTKPHTDLRLVSL